MSKTKAGDRSKTNFGRDLFSIQLEVRKEAKLAPFRICNLIVNKRLIPLEIRYTFQDITKADPHSLVHIYANTIRSYCHNFVIHKII